VNEYFFLAPDHRDTVKDPQVGCCSGSKPLWAGGCASYRLNALLVTQANVSRAEGISKHLPRPVAWPSPSAALPSRQRLRNFIPVN